MRMFGLHHDPLGAVIGLSDGAHATLHTEDLAAPAAGGAAAPPAGPTDLSSII